MRSGGIYYIPYTINEVLQKEKIIKFCFRNFAGKKGLQTVFPYFEFFLISGGNRITQMQLFAPQRVKPLSQPTSQKNEKSQYSVSKLLRNAINILCIVCEGFNISSYFIYSIYNTFYCSTELYLFFTLCLFLYNEAENQEFQGFLQTLQDWVSRTLCSPTNSVLSLTITLALPFAMPQLFTKTPHLKITSSMLLNMSLPSFAGL